MGEEAIKKPVALNVQQLLDESKYIIPFYQRNYAWEYPEINQLLCDIWEACAMTNEDFYYLGTLVVAEKEKLGETYYEVVDGQQRHTTLSIIHAVISQKDKNKRNLYFEARQDNEEALDILFGTKEKNEQVGSASFYTAKQIVEQFWEDKDERQKANFHSFFYERVTIFRVILPKDTDLNHYFEIMNSRGEQLEQHEILKARLMDKIMDSNQQHIFSVIWDACSDMDGFVIQKIAKSYRIALFGENYDNIPSKEEIIDFNLDKKEGINKDFGKEETNISEKKIWTLSNIIDNHKIESNFNQKTANQANDKFSSVIDFPNFILQIRKLSKSEVSLDDKYLLKQFDDLTSSENIMSFIHDLLKYRILFDNYIIKREKGDSNWNWSIKHYTNDDNHPYKLTIQEESVAETLKMIQSMFHVTFTTNNYKNWLFESLQYLKGQSTVIEVNTFLKHLFDLAKKRYDESKDNITFAGLKTPRFIFNFIDFLLWTEYYKYVRGENSTQYNDALLIKIAGVKAKFYAFKFAQKSSIEHLFPQSRIDELYDSNITHRQKNETMDSLGNLCLVSKSTNSSLSNHLPYQKRNDSNLKNTNESLKQLIMFESFVDNTIWNTVQIEAHHKEMTDLLAKYTKQ